MVKNEWSYTPILSPFCAFIAWTGTIFLHNKHEIIKSSISDTYNTIDELSK